MLTPIERYGEFSLWRGTDVRPKSSHADGEWVSALARNYKGASRLFFLPPTTQFMKVPALEFGAVVYWNTIGNGHVRQLADGAVQKACALSEYGLRIVDHRIRESLLRPKTEVLPKTL